MRKKRIALFLCFLLIWLCACGSNGFSQSSTAQNYQEEIQEKGVAMNTQEMAAEDIAEAETDTSAVKTEDGSGVQAADSSRKLIKYQDYSVETKEFDTFVENLNQLVSETQGYIEYSEVSGNSYYGGSGRYASYTLRIPVNKLEVFQGKIQELGSIVRQSERVEDVTLRYVDTESHITALRTEQESLMKLLEQAEDVDAVIAIQSQLTQVRYELESYESQLRTYDNAIEYSTISLYLTEVERETQTADSFWEQLKERLGNSLYGMKNGLVGFLLWFLGAIPYWILLAALVFVGVMGFKKSKGFRTRRKEKKKRAKKAEQNSIAQEAEASDTKEKIEENTADREKK